MRSALLPLLLAASATWADEPKTLAEAPAPSVEISLKLGGHFSQLLSRLGTSGDASLTVGFAPLMGGRLQFFASVGYSQPSYTLSSTDRRLGDAGAPYTSTVLIRDLATTVGGKFFFLPPTKFVVPYAGLGLRVHFLRADVAADAGADFGKHYETDTRFGGVLLGGVGIRLGPGLVLGEFAIDYSPIAQRVTGDANVGALVLVLGYGLWL